MAFLNGDGWNECVVAPAPKSQTIEDEDRHCRSCHAQSLIVDWSAGDRVCTNCGVVDEDHIRDSRPEWREFNDADDLAKGLPSAARCGLVPVDESRYIGGLQPTTLSKTVFGGGSGFNERRKRLFKTNQKMEYMIQKQHAKALRATKVSTKGRHGEEHQGFDGSVRPDHESLLLQEEEDAQRSRDALYAEKWSIERALLLHGHDQDASTTHGPLHHGGGQEEREDLVKRLDKPLLKASEELYRAYCMLQDASRKLHLPDRVLHEATAVLCKYATRRDGILVKGVLSRMSSKSDSTILNEKEAAERLRAYNKLKQTGALGSALLFLTARKLGWTRSLPEVCSSFQPQQGGKDAFVKPKHCSRAMNEVRALFPHYGQAPAAHPHQQRTATTSSGGNADSIAGFVEHATRKLELPPVALASVRTLVQHFQKEQMETETKSVAKISTICASLSLFVSLAGASLQRLAQQTHNSDTIMNQNSKRRSVADSDKPSKRIKMEWTKDAETTNDSKAIEQSTLLNRLFDEDVVPTTAATHEVTPDRTETATGAVEPFDVFSHSAVEYQASEKRKYEMRRIWDAWNEQMPWYRSIGRIEQSCGVSRNSVLQFYKTRIFPRRQALLQVLQDNASSMSNDAPLASVLLKNIATAAPMMNSKGQL